MEGRRIVSEDWIAEVTSWRADEQQALFAKGKHTNSTALLEDYDVVHGPDGHEEGALGVAYKSCEPLGKPLLALTSSTDRHGVCAQSSGTTVSSVPPSSALSPLPSHLRRCFQRATAPSPASAATTARP